MKLPAIQLTSVTYIVVIGLSVTWAQGNPDPLNRVFENPPDRFKGTRSSCTWD